MPRTDRRSIDDYDTDEVMAAFRQACRGRGDMERDELIREVARRLGFQRLGSTIETALRGHLRAAIRRKLVGADGRLVFAETRAMTDCTRDELVEFVCSVMRPGYEHDRDDVIEAVARHLGFARVRGTVAAPVRSAINTAVRLGALSHEGPLIWRVR